jgi:hypothetical protein
MRINLARGFSGMLGSLGQFTGKEKEPTIVLEAVASYDLWIWHAFLGTPSSNNDINVLDRSHLFAELASRRAPEVNFTVNGRKYNMGYFLADREHFLNMIPLILKGC